MNIFMKEFIEKDSMNIVQSAYIWFFVRWKPMVHYKMFDG